MKYYKQFLLMVLFVLFGLVVWYGLSEGLVYMFTIPIFAVGVFLTFYLSREFDVDVHSKKGTQPDTLHYIQSRKWTIIIYCVFFFLITAFVWSYLNSNLLTAIKDFSYMGVLIWLFVLYVLLAPSLLEKIETKLSKSLKLLTSGEWTRGYLFLLPITFLIYILYPYEELQQFIIEKIFFFPLFFIVYTFAFVAVYCITYLYESMRSEDIKLRPGEKALNG
ncbi:MAG: hypothetical protein AAB553_02850 [Patescibacteria group bacterium]